MPHNSPITFLPQGAILHTFTIADHNIVLSFPDPTSYARHNTQYIGETVGRAANRIPSGNIQSLNGRSYQLPINRHPNHLHGGTIGWGKKIFEGPETVERGGRKATRFSYVSPDGEEGYPGTVELVVWYYVSEEEEDGLKKTVLEVEYQVELVGDECEETIVNVTNHSYFNLDHAPTIAGTFASLPSTQHLPVDNNGVPLGTIAPFPGITPNVPFELNPLDPDDFTSTIDHCFIAHHAAEGSSACSDYSPDPSTIPLDTRTRPATLLVSLSHPSTNIHLEVHSTEPAFQFYTGGGLKQAASEHGPEWGAGAGFCVEPSRYVNAINIPEWRNMVVLRRGEKWGCRNIYRAWKS